MSVAVVLTGPPGAGKTSVLERLTTLLELEGVEFGALEVEQLGWGSPWLDADVVYRQVASVLEHQRMAGRHRFLVAATTETTEELAALVAAIGGDRVVTVLLTAPPEVVAARLDAREPDDWPGKQPLLQHARDLAETMLDLSGVDFSLSTVGCSVNDAAQRVHDRLAALGALSGPSGPGGSLT